MQLCKAATPESEGKDGKMGKILGRMNIEKTIKPQHILSDFFFVTQILRILFQFGM